MRPPHQEIPALIPITIFITHGLHLGKGVFEIDGAVSWQVSSLLFWAGIRKQRKETLPRNAEPLDGGYSPVYGVHTYLLPGGQIPLVDFSVFCIEYNQEGCNRSTENPVESCVLGDANCPSDLNHKQSKSQVQSIIKSAPKPVKPH
jgi:hypothetical protein